jgi:hypothetical protein
MFHKNDELLRLAECCRQLGDTLFSAGNECNSWSPRAPRTVVAVLDPSNGVIHRSLDSLKEEG